MADNFKELARRQAAGLTPVNTGTLTDSEIDRLYRIARALALSGVFKDVTQAEQAFAKILIGRDLGLSPAQSLSSMDFVKGNVQLRSVTLAAFVKRHPGYDYIKGEHTAEKCEILFREVDPEGNWRDAGTSTFTIEQAKKAGLLSKDGPWRQYPENMLFARAISNGVKQYAPDLLGGIPVYTEGDSFDSTAEDITDLLAGAPEQPEAVELPPEVEAVVARATKLGHAGWMNRDAAAMAAGPDVPTEARQAWVERVSADLDRVEAAWGQEDAPFGTADDYIEWWDDEPDNARWYRHVGCDGTSSKWVAPLDGASSPEATTECARCCHVRPLKPHDGPPSRLSGDIQALYQEALEAFEHAKQLREAGQPERSEEVRQAAEEILAQADAAKDAQRRTT